MRKSEINQCLAGERTQNLYNDLHVMSSVVPGSLVLKQCESNGQHEMGLGYIDMSRLYRHFRVNFLTWELTKRAKVLSTKSKNQVRGRSLTLLG